MWDGGRPRMNLHPLLWETYHMSIINQLSINEGII